MFLRHGGKEGASAEDTNSLDIPCGIDKDIGTTIKSTLGGCGRSCAVCGVTDGRERRRWRGDGKSAGSLHHIADNWLKQIRRRGIVKKENGIIVGS